MRGQVQKGEGWSQDKKRRVKSEKNLEKISNQWLKKKLISSKIKQTDTSSLTK